MIKAIILGILEGLTEFLPVSSTGHLILANKYLDFEGSFANLFAVVIQMGAILAVIIYFWKKLFPSFNSKVEYKSYISLWSKVVVGIIPAAIIGIPFVDMIDKYLFNKLTVAIALIVGALLLIVIDKGDEDATVLNESEIKYSDAFKIGLFQCLCLIPGMSRSASTIIGGLHTGLKREVAAEFSFFLAIPVICGATLIKLVKYGFNFTNEEWLLLGVGTAVSFIVAYIVIAVFMGYIKKKTLKPFAYYRIALGTLVLLTI